MKLEQLLLLAVRCLTVLLLVAAMASVTPWAEAVWHRINPEGGIVVTAGGARRYKVLVVDGSFSMAQRPGKRADAAARRLFARPAGRSEASSALGMPAQRR